VRFPDPPLLLVTDRKQAAFPLIDVVAAALSAGCRWVSVREKDLPEAKQISIAQELLPLVRRFGTCLTLHGDIAASQSIGIDGIHLPDGGDVVAVRRRWGADKLIGISVHNAAQAATLDLKKLDYVVAGPVFETKSKFGYGPALGRDGLSQFVRATTLPVFAIGGIDAGNVAEVISVGAAGIAVMGGVMRASDPERETRAFLDALAEAGR
jgi:thiamine-phosphate pyrophosphorylase